MWRPGLATVVELFESLTLSQNRSLDERTKGAHAVSGVLGSEVRGACSCSRVGVDIQADLHI